MAPAFQIAVCHTFFAIEAAVKGWFMHAGDQLTAQ
jgi:hypothetical protein